MKLSNRPLRERPLLMLLHLAQVTDGLIGLTTIGYINSGLALRAAGYLCRKRMEAALHPDQAKDGAAG